MRRAAYIPAAVIGKTKINEVISAGEATTTGVRGGWRLGTWGGLHVEESEVGVDLRGDTVVLGFWSPLSMCVFDICVVDTDTDYFDGRHPHKILSQHEHRKKGKIY